MTTKFRKVLTAGLSCDDIIQSEIGKSKLRPKKTNFLKPIKQGIRGRENG